MAKSANQKLKLLYLAQILQEESDERHPMTVTELIAALARRGIAAERKSIYDDMEALERFGMDIVMQRGRGNSYYLGERHFEMPEIKLMVDAVQSAKFITEKKSRALIRKICALISRHQGGQMQRQVHVQGRAKTFNERTYYNVDTIHLAMTENRQIHFRYYEWVIDPKSPHLYARRGRRGGAVYVASPWTLLWDDEYYYLVAYDAAAGLMKHYRVDKMEEIELAEQTRQGAELFEELDAAHYSTGVFGMFGGEETDVRLRFANHLIGVIVDRYGSDIIIRADGEAHFVTTVKAVVSPQFYAWLFGFGDAVQVLAPHAVIAEIKKKTDDILKLY